MFWIAQALFTALGVDAPVNAGAGEDWRTAEARARRWRAEAGALPPSPAATPPGYFETKEG